MSFFGPSINIMSLTAQRALIGHSTAMAVSLERLSTGLRINRGADDPSGVMAVAQMTAEAQSLRAAINNGERADHVLNVVDAGLGEVSLLLTELEGLVLANANDAGLTQAEKEANQIQVDSILMSIDKIANQASFQGTKLLSGTYDYIVSGIDTTQIDEARIHNATIADGSSVNVTIEVVQSAQTGRAFIDTTTGGTPGVSGTTLAIEVVGNVGIQQFSFTSGTTRAQMVSSINAFSDATGVSAITNGAALIQLDSTELGAEQFASVSKVSGDAAYDDNFSTSAAVFGSISAKDFGRDVSATINGVNAAGSGLDATIGSGHLGMTISVDSAYNTDGNTSTFAILDGGAKFNLGPDVNLGSQASIAFPTVTTGRLGNARDGRLMDLQSGGAVNILTGNLTTAQKIMDSAISQAAKMRGRIGSFQKDVIGPSVRLNGASLEAVLSARSDVRDTDIALETANLTRQQVLISASISALAIANAQPANLLNLLKPLNR